MPQYAWERFWYQSGSELPLTSTGFLMDPDDSYTKFYNERLIGLAGIDDKPCVILLGEPGLGKSVAVREHVAQVKADTARCVFLFDLKDYGSDYAVHLNLFSSPNLAAALRSGKRVDLYLDSLDEGLLQVNTLAGFIAQELSNADRNRLFLRIVCRPAAWPTTFQQQLEQIWKPIEVATYNLCPLRQRDVIEAAEAVGCNGDQFLTLLVDRRATSFARKPLTLNMLLHLYRDQGSFPETNVELYRQGCLTLCTELNPSRQQKKTATLSPNERLGIAERIAALTIFGNFNIITSVQPQDPPSGADLTPNDVLGTEWLDGSGLRVDHRALGEALDTALFKWNTADKAVWDHRSYAEFLAAAYCTRHRFNLQAIRDLLLTEVAGQKKIVPQLYETAAWLANMSDDVRADILQVDPTVLLRSDVAVLGAADRKALTSYTLDLVEQELFSDQFLGGDFAVLQHSTLADQLRPFISDKRRSLYVRRFAMDIVESCKTEELDFDLLALACDPSERVSLRAHAAWVIYKIGSAAIKEQLVALISGSDVDPDDELKGWALQSVWPSHISAHQLFSVLTVPKNSNLYGSYASFLYDLAKTLEQELRCEDILAALDYLASHLTAQMEDRLAGVANAILLKAWHCMLADNRVPKLFATVLVSAAKDHLPVGQNELAEKKLDVEALFKSDVARRRVLLSACISVVAKAGYDVDLLIYSRQAPLTTEDADWLVERVPDSPQAEIDVILRLLDRVPLTRPALDAIARGVEREILPDRFRRQLFVEFGSSDMAAQRHAYAVHLWYDVRGRHHRRRLLTPPVEERVTAALEKIEAGDMRFWLVLTRELTLTNESTHYGMSGSDITTLPGWIGADAPTRERIANAAEAFVYSYKPAPDEFIGKNQFPSTVIAAYQALGLLLRVRRACLEVQQSAFWDLWMPLVLWYPFDSQTDIEPDLIAVGCTHAPEAAVRAALMLTSGDPFHVRQGIEKLKPHWTTGLQDALSEAVAQVGPAPSWTARPIDELVSRGDSRTVVLLHEAIQGRHKGGQDDITVAVRCAVSLVRNDAPRQWNKIWAIICADEPFGIAVVESLADDHRYEFVTELSEPQAADLLIWIANRYPPSSDPQHERVYSPGTRDLVADLRNTLPRYLAALGTPAALAELRRARKRIRNSEWIRWHELSARSNVLQKSWIPVKPRAFLEQTDYIERKLRAGGASRQTEIIIGLATTLIGIAIQFFVPSSLTFLEKLGIAVTAGLSLAFVYDVAHKRRSAWFYPLLIILSSVLIAGFVYFTFFRISSR